MRIGSAPESGRLWIRTSRALRLKRPGWTEQSDPVNQSVAERIRPPREGESSRHTKIGDGKSLFGLVVREAEEVLSRPLMPRAVP